MEDTVFDVRHTFQLTSTELAELQTLLDLVYAGDFSPEDWDHALGGLHTLAWRDGQLIGHASVVQRAVLVGVEPYRAGYVEGMGVHPDWQGQGIGRALMQRVNDQMARGYDFGLLSPSDEGRPLYAQAGWVDWRGELRCFTPTGMIVTPDEEIMAYGPPRSVWEPLTCDYRSGDVW